MYRDVLWAFKVLALLLLVFVIAAFLTPTCG